MKSRFPDEDNERVYFDSIRKFQSAIDNPPFSSELLAKLHLNGTVFVLVLLGFFLGKFGFSFSTALFVVYSFSFLFERQYTKYSRSLKALVYRYASSVRFIGGVESVEWMNGILGRVWRVLEPEVSKQVFREVNPILQDKCPPFLCSVRLTAFTLGSLPPRIDGIVFIPEPDETKVTFECLASFLPLQVGADAHAFISRTRRAEWNSRIELAARFGARGAGVDLPVRVTELAFSGRMRVSVTLVRSLSVVECVTLCFVEDPLIDFTVVPLRTVDLMNVPLLSSWIHATLTGTLRSALVAPNKRTIDLRTGGKKALPGILSVAMGVVRVRSSRGLRLELAIDGRRVRQTRTIPVPKHAVDEAFELAVDGVDSLLSVRAVSEGRGETLAEGFVDLATIRALGAQVITLRLTRRNNLVATVHLHLHYASVQPLQQCFTDALYKAKRFGTSDDRKVLHEMEENQPCDGREKGNSESKNACKDNRMACHGLPNHRGVIASGNDFSAGKKILEHGSKTPLVHNLIHPVDDQEIADFSNEDSLFDSFNVEDLLDKFNSQQGFNPSTKNLYTSAKQLKEPIISLQTRLLVKITIIGAEDLRSARHPRAPSPYFTLLVAPKQSETTPVRKASPLRIVAATASLLGGAVGILTGGTRDELLGSADTTCFAYRSCSISDSHAPLFNQRLSFVSSAPTKDMLIITLHDTADDAPIGTASLRISDLQPGNNTLRLTDCQAGTLRIHCELFAEQPQQTSAFIPYTTAVKLTLHSIATQFNEGVFFCTIQTPTGTFLHEHFQLGDFFTKQEILFPVIYKTFNLTLYRQTTKEAELIGSCLFTLLPEHACEENSQILQRTLPSTSEIYAKCFSHNNELKMISNTEITTFMDEMVVRLDTKPDFDEFTAAEATETGLPIFKSLRSEAQKIDAVKILLRILNKSIREHISSVHEKTDLNALVRGGILKNNTNVVNKEQNNKNTNKKNIMSNKESNLHSLDKNKSEFHTQPFTRRNDGKSIFDIYNHLHKEGHIKNDQKDIDSFNVNNQGPQSHARFNFSQNNIASINIVNKNEEAGKITYSITTAKLMKYKGTSEAPDNLKVIQARFTKFENPQSDFYIEFYNNDEMVQRTIKSKNNIIRDKFTFFCGKGEIRAVFKSAKQTKNTFMGDYLIAKRQTNDSVLLDEHKFKTTLQTIIYGCNFTKLDRIDKGNLEIFIKHAKNLKIMDTKSSDPYIKLYLNNIEILKTAVKKNTLNPIFNESCLVKTRRTTDILRIELHEWNQIGSNILVASREFPLFFLKEGFMDFSIRLLDQKTNEKLSAEIQVAFSFTKPTQNQQ